jgi:predicted transcriptional regulator
MPILSGNKDLDFDAIMDILSSTTRRKILQLLTTEDLYPFQISRILDISPRIIGKYIDELVELGIVETYESERIKGPSRRYAKLNKSFSFIIDISPSNFSWKIVPIENILVEAIEDEKEIIVSKETSNEILEIRDCIRAKIEDIELINEKRKKLVHEINEAYSRFNKIIDSIVSDYYDREIMRALFKVIVNKSSNEISLVELANETRMWQGTLVERLTILARETKLVKIVQDKKGMIWFSI